jgi:hypothetical protein
MALHKVDKRLYYTADKSRVVEEGDPDAAFLYATPGIEVPADEYKRLTHKAEAEPVVVHSTAADPEPKAKAQVAEDDDEKAEAKAVHKPEVQDKAIPGPAAERRERR